MKFIKAIEEFSRFDKLGRTMATSRGRKTDLMQLCLYLRNPEIEDVSHMEVCQYLQEMVEYGYTGNGVYKKAITYRVFWKYLNKRKFQVFDHELIPFIKVPARIPSVATQENYNKLLTIIPGTGFIHVRNRAVINMLWDTGARIGEIVSLDLKHVDIKERKALIRTEKSRGQRALREIFWSAETNKNLLKYLKERSRVEGEFEFKDPQALFVGRPREIQWGRISIHCMNIALRKYSKKGKLPNMNPHSFRHHFAHDIVKKGGSNADVMNLLGHSRLESSRVYTQMYGKELEERWKHFKGLKV